MEQNFKNHTRFSPPFHFVAMPLTFVAIGFSINEFTKSQNVQHALIIVAFVLLLLTLLITRLYALGVQNRAIKTAETLRYFMLSNKVLPSSLKLEQIIALRFASDDELLSLTDRAVAENLSSKDIKMAIKNWRGDYHRV